LAGLPFGAPYQAEDLIGGTSAVWAGERQQLSLDPKVNPAQIFWLARSSDT